MSVDSDSRDAIVKNLDKNYFVQANAGSGKTTSLVNRMVALIERSDPQVKVDKICTITFTKAAADEFFERFQKLLSTRSILVPDDSDKDLGAKDKDTVARCQEALANIDQCFLGTIDSFLSTLAHELPSEIGVPSDSKVIEEDERMRFVMNQFEEILTDKMNPLHNEAVRFNQVFYPSHDCFSIGVKLLNDKRGMDIIYDHSLVGINIDTYLAKEKADFLDVAKTIADDNITFIDPAKPNGTAKKREDSKKNIARKYKTIQNLTWHDHIYEIQKLAEEMIGLNLFPSFSAHGSSLEQKGYIEQKEDAKGNPTKNHVYSKATQELLEKVRDTLDNYKHALYFNFIVNALKQVSAELKNEGKFSFYDFLYYVTEAFKESAATDRKLVDHVFFRHSYFLLDESQDTDPLQTQLFFYITGTKKSSDWRQVEPKEGSLFIVGDPKQSIYAFRGANIIAYENVRKLFDAKNEVLTLTKNFRSLPSLKTWFNTAMDPVLNHGVNPLPHPSIEMDVTELPNEVNTKEPSGVNTYRGVYKYTVKVEKDAEYVANLINELVNKDEHQILVKNPDKKSKIPYIYRKIEYKDFLVVPRGKDVNEYIYEFNKYHIPHIVEANIPFSASEVLLSLSLLAKLLKSPADKTLFIDVLYFCYHLDESDVIKLNNQKYSFDISDVSLLTVKEAEYIKIINELHTLYEATKDMSYSSLLNYLINNGDLSLLKKVSSASLEYAYFFIEKVKEKEETGLLSSVPLFNEFVDSFLVKNANDNRVLRFKNKVNRVKIANLHKVKGLQAPIVILNKPREKKRSTTSFIDYNVTPPQAHFASILNPRNRSFVVRSRAYSESEINNWASYEEAERDRLAYVAATRAESVLIISSPEEIDGHYFNPWQKLIDQIPASEVFPILPINTPSKPTTDNSIYLTPVISSKCKTVSLTFKTPSTSGIHHTKNNDDVIDMSKEDEANSSDKENATLKGTLVHKLLELIVSSGNGYKDINILVKSIINKYDGSNQYEALLVNVANTFINGGFKQKNSTIKNDLLSVLLNAEEVYCETPFSYRKDDTIINGVIDLLYKDDKGYHVIDYKTNKLDDVSILEKEYKNQLQDYINALKEMGIDSDAHIYHIAVE